MNRKEYNIAIDKYSERVFRYAFRWTKDEALAKDIVQETFEKLWGNRKKVEAEKAKSWVFTVAHRLLINESRKRKTEHSDDFKFADTTFGGSRYELKDLIDVALNTLPDLQRSILLLRDSEGYNYKEIGEILNLSESQVKVYLFRARKKIKTYLKDLSVLVV